MQTATRDGRAAPAAARAGRRTHLGRVGALAGAVGALAYVGLVDPGGDRGLYPACPSRLLLGIDCPACGGLRGTHDLLHGDLVGALDHNLILPLLLSVYAYGAAAYVAPLLGRTVPAVHPPRWLLVAGATLLGVFMVLRNLPVAGLEFLDSRAS